MTRRCCIIPALHKHRFILSGFMKKALWGCAESGAAVENDGADVHLYRLPVRMLLPERSPKTFDVLACLGALCCALP